MRKTIVLGCAALWMFGASCSGPSPAAPEPSAEPASPSQPAPAPEPAAPQAETEQPKPAEQPGQGTEATTPQPSPTAEPAKTAESAQTAKSAQPAAEAKPQAASPAAAPGASPCGEKGQPKCPLQAWMENNLQKALEANDLDKLAAGLTRAASFVPDPSWNSGPQGWRAIAEGGAQAASKGDLDIVRQTCKSCHKAWRGKYKQSHRLRPITR